jgi:hypothetical protein
LSFGFFAAVVLAEIDKASEIRRRVPLKTFATVFIFFFLVITPISIKVVTPYNWWGLTAESYSEANHTTDISYFGGIRMTADEKFVYEDFVDRASRSLGPDDGIYCFSQIGVFYVLADRVPNVKAPMPWFDVSRDVTILEDLEYLQNNRPKMIVFADCGIDVIKAHEDGFRGGGESGHRAMYYWLTECRDSNTDYTVDTVYQIHDYLIYVMLRNDPA